ncbi:MAG: AAA family ATPase [Chitinophagales bacterium]
MWKFRKYEVGQEIDWDDMSQSFSWIEDMKGVQQDAIWHAEGDVFTHTKMVVETLVNLDAFKALNEQEKHILVTSAIMHDIEKRSCTQEEVIDGKTRIVSPRHAKRGEYTARAILYRDFKVPFEVREQICKLVRLHGLPLWAITKENPTKEVIYASTVVNTEHLALLAQADILGRICTDADDILLKIELFRELCKENDCFGKVYDFKSNYGRFLYFNKEESAPNYEPFDDLICTVNIMCALPGSGKDTYIKKHLNLPILSLDDIRRRHKISPTDKKSNGRVVQMAKEEAKQFLRTKTNFVFNATNITKDMRSKWIQLFTDYNARVKIIYVEVPYLQMLKQNKNREHIVPQKVIEKMIWKLEMPTVLEAHDVEHVVKD